MKGIAKRLLAARVRRAFADPAKPRQPMQRADNGLFPPGSVARRVNGDVTTMMVGGIASLLLQMLHPAVLAGVWDHSNFRADMHGRLRRTARFIALTTYGDRDHALQSIARVRQIHDNVCGVLPDGMAYSANDPELLTWVHVTETLSFLDAWIRYAEPNMSMADQDRYFAEMAIVAEHLGASDPPTSRAETIRTIDAMRPSLHADHRTREVLALVLQRPQISLDTVPLALIQRAAIDLIPSWARRMHRLPSSGLARPLVGGGTYAMARTLQWAMR